MLEHPGIVQHMRGKGVFVKIKGMLRAMEAAIQYKLDIDHASYDFHSAVLTAAHTPIIVLVSSFLTEQQYQSRHKTLNSMQRIEEALTFHKKIYDKISTRASYGAADSMRRHLLHARNQLFAETPHAAS